MRIESVIKRVHSLPDSWVRVEQIHRTRKGLDLWLAVYEGRRGKKTDAWLIGCLGVREFKIADLDGGGLALYTSTHPAARQYVARPAELRWVGGGDPAAVLGALFQAHINAVDDWISIDVYEGIGSAVFAKKAICRGPDFLMRAYAKALRALGVHVHISRCEKTANRRWPLRGFFTLVSHT